MSEFSCYCHSRALIDGGFLFLFLGFLVLVMRERDGREGVGVVRSKRKEWVMNGLVFIWCFVCGNAAFEALGLAETMKVV